MKEWGEEESVFRRKEALITTQALPPEAVGKKLLVTLPQGQLLSSGGSKSQLGGVRQGRVGRGEKATKRVVQ